MYIEAYYNLPDPLNAKLSIVIWVFIRRFVR